jgi:hypothetical protein
MGIMLPLLINIGRPLGGCASIVTVLLMVVSVPSSLQATVFQTPDVQVSQLAPLYCWGHWQVN